MIFTLSTLKEAAKSRAPGYLEAVLAIAKPLDNNRYELTNEQIASLSEYRKPFGLGDATKTVIHAGIDMLPLSAVTKTKIKGCKKCVERAASLNRVIPNIRLFN